MNRNLLRQLLVVAAVIATLAVNGLANALPINGQTTGEVSDRFSVYFVPAGYVFSIWGLIYLGLIAYAIYQALPAQRNNARLRSIDWPFVVSSLANIAWIFLWHYEQFVLTIVAMLVLLVSLILIYLRLDIGRSAVPAAERWLVHLVFSIYLGWITVATIANITSVLEYAGWNGFGLSDEAWLVIMLAMALVVAALMTWMRRDTAYLLVLVWAFTGIGVKFPGVAVVAPAAWTAMAIVVLLAAASLVWRRPQRPSAPAA